MSQHRKQRGYESQSILAEYLQGNGFPWAFSTGAGRQGTDVTGTPGLDWEVAARRGFVVTEKMQQAIRRVDEGVLPVTVLRPDGWGPSRIGMWPLIVPLSAGVRLLRAAGYGDPLVTASEE